MKHYKKFKKHFKRAKKSFKKSFGKRKRLKYYTVSRGGIRL